MKLGLFLVGMASAMLIAAPLRAQNLAQPAVSQDCGTAQSCTASLAVSVTAGNSLIAVVRLTAITSVSGTTITDSRSNTWILDGSVVQYDSPHILAVYRAVSANAGLTSFTVSNNNSSTMRIVGLAEVTGLAAGPPEAQASALGSGNLAQPGAITTTQANDYVLVAAGTDGNNSYSAAQPFLVESQATRAAYADALPPQPSTLTPSVAFGVSDDWFAIALAYKTSGKPRLPVFLSLQYDDGTPVAGSAVLSSLANGTKTTIQTWPINSNGQVSLYCPIVNTGSYAYDLLDPNGNTIQSIVILPGGFISLVSTAHSLKVSVTLNKSTHAVAIPVSFAFQ
jgi:hypothetical protein